MTLFSMYDLSRSFPFPQKMCPSVTENICQLLPFVFCLFSKVAVSVEKDPFSLLTSAEPKSKKSYFDKHYRHMTMGTFV